MKIIKSKEFQLPLILPESIWWYYSLCWQQNPCSIKGTGVICKQARAESEFVSNWSTSKWKCWRSQIQQWFRWIEGLSPLKIRVKFSGLSSPSGIKYTFFLRGVLRCLWPGPPLPFYVGLRWFGGTHWTKNKPGLQNVPRQSSCVNLSRSLTSLSCSDLICVPW